MKTRPIPLLLAAAVCCGALSAQDLKIDFSQTGGPIETGYSGYVADHEQPDTFTPQTYSAFGGTDNVTLTPTFGGTPLAGQNPQMIKRTSGSDLLIDWLGVDNRAANGFDGNPITLTISGVPAGIYRLTTTHHDTNNQTGLVNIMVTDADGSRLTENFDQSSGTQPPAVFETLVRSDGTSDIVMEIDSIQGANTTGFAFINALVLAEADRDGDGLDDLWEDKYFGDGDGVATDAELALQNGTDDGYPTADGDGLDNLGEQTAGTDPNVADTDADGRSDGEEVNGPVTSDPLKADTDDDGLSDGEEVDGTSNPYKNHVLGTPPGDPTDPNLADTDGDTIPDPDEMDGTSGWKTNPNRMDTDGDNFPDNEEIANAAAGFDPLVDNSGDDFDSDGLDNAGELDAGTDPLLADTDGDGRLDGEEVHGPVTSDPLLYDTDGDLINDKAEVDNGTDPNDPDDFPSVAWLQINFSSYPDGPGEVLYQNWLALHETNSLDSDPDGGDEFGVDRLSQPYAAFGTTVSVSVSYPDLDRGTNSEAELATVKQLILRSDANAANYDGEKLGLVKAWIGTDARLSQMGNGTDAPTTMRLEIAGLPAGTYLLRTYHHDVEYQHGAFAVRVTDADSADELLGDQFRVTCSTAYPQYNENPGAGKGPEVLRSTIEQVIRSNGTDPVILDFQKFEDPTIGLGRGSLFVLNGLELKETTDSNNNDIADDVELAVFGDLTTSNGRASDTDRDGIDDLTELLLNLDPTNADSDGDGLADGLETNTGEAGITEPIRITSFSYDEAAQQITMDWTPAVKGDVKAGTDLAGFPELAAGGVTPPVTFSVPANLSGEPKAFYRVEGPPAGTGTSPYVVDTDGDGVSDGDEVNKYGSDPLNTESDGDGYGDGYEVFAGSSPADAADIPDRDGDGFNNAYETDHGTDPDDAESYPEPDPATALYVDFNSDQDNGGDSMTESDPSLSVAHHNQRGYQSYHANHEVASEFTTANYNAFGTTVTLTPTWPDTTDNRVMQSIDRTKQDPVTGMATQWDGLWQGDRLNLLTDWLGVDTRTSNGGNGDYDGTNGLPTRLELTLGGLPAGTYHWRSYHHDTEKVWDSFLMEVSTDGGDTWTLLPGSLQMTNSGAGSIPPSSRIYRGFPTNKSPYPEDLPSTVETDFTADGTNNVVLRFTPLSSSGVHLQLWGINGFELTKKN